MITDEPIPYTSTGPAMVNIFAATPKTNPSFLNSIAGDTTALANPVIGIIYYLLLYYSIDSLLL